MSRIPTAPPGSIFNLDLKPMKPFLVDLAARAMVGMRRAKEGWMAVQVEIIGNQAAYGQRAGITPGDFTRFVTLNDQFAQIAAALPIAEKALEVLMESAAHVDNLRHRLITQFANAAEDHARMAGGDPTLLTAYEQTIAYRGIIADKAAETRKKNEEAKKNGSTPGAAAAPPAAAPRQAKAPEPITRTPNPPPDLIFTLALMPLAPFLVDLPPGATRGMRRKQPGWEAVVAEVTANQKKHGDAAGITDGDFQRFLDLNDQMAQIEAQIPIAEKAVEVLTESLAYTDNLRHQLATRFADSAEEHAQSEGGDPTLLTAYEKTIAYRAVSADKGVKTRQRNEEAKKAAGGKGPTSPGGAGGSGGSGPQPQ
jgi:hypothetical protein